MLDDGNSSWANEYDQLSTVHKIAESKGKVVPSKTPIPKSKAIKIPDTDSHVTYRPL